ncbi:MAG: M1 family peptidase, partial [Planctomycetes bacterium]|nr:M1 family peptidase [Planctomycetota bacterium]
VGSNEKRYAWQDEGFTSFWTTLCRDDFTQKASGPQRGIMSYVATVRRGGDAVCMRHADTYGDDNFVFASYAKPAAVLHQLRGLLGDDTFFGAFRRYARDWAFKHPTPYDFFRTFGDHAGIDLEPYFRTWMFETWTLDHGIADVTVRSGRTTVTIEDLGRAIHPCIVEATFADGEKSRGTVSMEHWRGSTTATVEFAGEAVKVELDPDITSLDIDRKNGVWQASR